MPRSAGNDIYFAELQAEMDREGGITRKMAEINVLYPIIRAYKLKDGLRYEQIQKILHERYAIGKAAFWTRLAWIKEVKALP